MQCEANGEFLSRWSGNEVVSYKPSRAAVVQRLALVDTKGRTTSARCKVGFEFSIERDNFSVRRARVRINALKSVVEHHVPQRTILADITALVVIDFAKLIKLRIKPEQNNLARWHEAVSSRPSAEA